MIRTVSILFTLVSYAVSDDCVRYTFEDKSEWYGNGTINNSGFCNGRPVWVVGNYSSLNLTGQNERSISFIAPQSTMNDSCAQSFTFRMNYGGTLEVNFYMETVPGNDLFIVARNNTGQVMGIYDWFWIPNFVGGWHTARITLDGWNSYDGYITIYGNTSPDSIVLVDSFRYIPPGMKEQECQLYDSETTTPDSTTLASTTPELSTPDSTTKEPTTPDSTTSEPTTREPTTPETTSPQPTTSDPSESKTITFLMKMKMIFKL